MPRMRRLIILLPVAALALAAVRRHRRDPEKQWYKPNADYTAADFERDRVACTDKKKTSRRGLHEAARLGCAGRRHRAARQTPGSHEVTRPPRASTSLRGVIFDFGGVLWDMRWDVARQLDQAHGLPRSSVFETLYRTGTWEAVERGRGDRQAWLEAAHEMLEARAGRPLPPLHEEWRASQRAIEPNLRLVSELRGCATSSPS